ncbi:MAG: UDP-3-O-(3-hydroxymyristoyl)glucosamine N-acyltransferase, partial [Planctomycetales bacterium]
TVGLSPQATIHPSATFGVNCHVFPGAYIAANVSLGRDCVVHPGAVISENCRIGDGCRIHPNAVLYPNVILGSRVILHANAVLGADGFGYRFRNGAFQKIPQLGWVVVEDDVEIGAAATIDRGMIGPTVIGQGTKIDNLVMIGHNCEIGKHNAFASQVGFAGSVTTGDYVRCAGQVGVADHVHLGTGCSLGAKAGIHKDMEGGKAYLGIPAVEEREQIKLVMSMKKIPELRRQMKDLEDQVQQLQEQLKALMPVAHREAA